MICVDNDLRSVEEIAAGLRSRSRGRVEEIGPSHRKREAQNARPTMAAYQCDLLDRNAIRRLAKKVEDEVGGIDVLVTCVGLPNQDIFDTASRTLMSHYWVSVGRPRRASSDRDRSLKVAARFAIFFAGKNSPQDVIHAC